MEKIKEIGGQLIDKAKTWYLGKWKTDKKVMIIVHIFIAVVLLGELLK